MVSSTTERGGGSLVYVTLLTLVAALGGLLFGYDTAVISGAIGFLETHFALDPQVWAGWAAACALIGCAVGAALAGLLSDRLGRRTVLILAAILFLVSSLGTALPRNFTQFIIFRILAGFGIGAASMTSPMYIAEISPSRIRGRMVSVNQFAIISGMLVVYFVNYFIVAYGATVDRQAVATSIEQHGPMLSAPAVSRFITDRLPKLDKAEVDQFIAEHDNALTGQQVADFVNDRLDKNEAKVDPVAAELAGREMTPWNVRRGWRWMFGSGVLPSVLFLLLLLLVPESPRWLTKQDRHSEALRILARVGGPDHARAELAEIETTIAQESGSLGQLFQPGMRLVLMIGVVLAVLQQITGINVFLYFAPKIFQSMGSGIDAALLQTVLVGAVNLTFTVIAIWTVDRLGRKPLMLVGFVGMGLSLLAMGLVAYYERMAVWVLIFVLGYIACFALSVGPVTWVILAEIFPTRIRGRAMAIATVCLWLANYVVTQTFTIMKENTWLVEKFHQAFPFWVYASFCALAVVFVWRFLPETKGKSLEEIERSWLPSGPTA
jgi:MFS family permease